MIVTIIEEQSKDCSFFCWMVFLVDYFIFLCKFLGMYTLPRLVSILVFLIAGFTAKSQDSTQVAAPKRLKSDLIATIYGDTLTVHIRKVDDRNVSFSFIGERLKQRIPKKVISTIYYKDGRVDKISDALFLNKVSEGASKIRVTKSDEDVQVYRQIAERVEGRYVGSSRNVYSNEYLERMAIADMKEVAYKNDPRVKVLLIKSVNITRGYDEDPSAVVTAEAYTR